MPGVPALASDFFEVMFMSVEQAQKLLEAYRLGIRPFDADEILRLMFMVLTAQ